MRVIVAGSRSIDDYGLVADTIRMSGFEIDEIVSGKEPNGVDRLGEDWADDNNIPVKPFPADWTRFGRPAGPIRNTQMADYADALIAIWDGKSSGTMDMISKAQKKGLKVFVNQVF